MLNDICFSPDDKYLATCTAMTEAKIRVSLPDFCTSNLYPYCFSLPDLGDWQEIRL
jgi:hypothetical protein